EHIRVTPGFSTRRWPPVEGMSRDENLRDLRRHADDFERRVGFTYTVLDDQGVVVGCVYIYPSRADSAITEVRSWVTARRAELDSVLYETVDTWLAADWPFTDVKYRNRV
ncbi:MAG: N-acetyltransferase, partial [Solirubrobacteraceae bacterium]